ncbi:hypothetical protein D3C76_701620 [compost metagenome]
MLTQGLDHRSAADIGHLGTVADQRLLFGGLDHAHAHARGADVQQLGLGVAGSELAMVLQVEVVVLHADARGQRQRLLDGNEVVVALPVGVDDVVSTDRTPPGLPAIDVGADRDNLVLGDHQRIRAAERAVEEVAVVVDVVVRGEDRRLDVLLGHVGPQTGVAGCVFLCGESRFDLFAVTDLQGLWHLHGRVPCRCEHAVQAGRLRSIATERTRTLLYLSDLELARWPGLLCRPFATKGRPHTLWKRPCAANGAHSAPTY